MASSAGIVALAIWALGTVVLVVAGASRGLLQPLSLLPDKQLLGTSSFQRLTNICAIIPVLTTAFNVQTSAPFVARPPLQPCLLAFSRPCPPVWLAACLAWVMHNSSAAGLHLAAHRAWHSHRVPCLP